MCRIEIENNFQLVIFQSYFEVKTVLNFAPATKNFDPALLSHTDFLILNEVEAEQLSELEIKSTDGAKNACLSLLDKYEINVGVVVTLGEKGVVYVDKAKREAITTPTPQVKVVDTSV
jgi:sugar/nucleoside kinase (ribokinase family)